MLEAVTFDLWETLITEKGGISDALGEYRTEEMHRVLTELGYEIPPILVVKAWDNAFPKLRSVQDAQRRPLTISEHIETFLRTLSGVSSWDTTPLLGDPSAITALAKPYTEAALHVPPLPMPGMREVLTQLREQGCKLAIICNTFETPSSVLRILLDRLDLARGIDCLVFSDEIGLVKPDPAIFEATLARLGVTAPSRAAHVGDRAETDVLGALRAGMHAVLFSPGKAACDPPAGAHLLKSPGELPTLLASLG